MDFLHFVIDSVFSRAGWPGLLDPPDWRKGEEFFLAECDGKPIGVASIVGLTGDQPPTLDRMYVLRCHRGNGAGALLTEAAVRRCEQLIRLPVTCHVTTAKMQRAIDRLPNAIRLLMNPISSSIGDEWLEDGLNCLAEQGRDSFPRD
jgi:GNAT superfamily N-acetyltransferase